MSPFHLFHLFIDWSELVGSLWLLVCWGCLFGVFLLLLYVADQSLRSSCLPITTLAQLHDCHSCNDERSIVQKKNLFSHRSYHKFPFLFSLRFWSQILSQVSISLLPPFLVTDPIISFHFSSASVFGHRSYHKFPFLFSPRFWSQILS